MTSLRTSQSHFAQQSTPEPPPPPPKILHQVNPVVPPPRGIWSTCNPIQFDSKKDCTRVHTCTPHRHVRVGSRATAQPASSLENPGSCAFPCSQLTVPPMPPQPVPTTWEVLQQRPYTIIPRPHGPRLCRAHTPEHVSSWFPSPCPIDHLRHCRPNCHYDCTHSYIEPSLQPHDVAPSMHPPHTAPPSQQQQSIDGCPP